jgi:hypothetical protein
MKLRVSLGFLLVAACTGEADIGPGGPAVVDPNDHLPVIGNFACDPSSGPVPLSSSCSWTVSDPDPGDTLSCSIDIGADGTIEYPFSSCPAMGSQMLTLMQVGDFRVQFTVTDSKGGKQTSVVTVTGTQAMVQPPNDNPPIITGYTVTPTAGVAPLPVSFFFTVYDPDNDPMTCRILEGSTEVVPSSACSTNERRTASLPQGTHNLTLEVKDSKGATATQTQTVTVSMAPPATDVTINKIEWGQTIMSASPRLVADKDALLRVYVLGNHAGVQGTVVTVTGTRGSQNFGPLTLTGPATAPTTADQTNLNQQWTVNIPGNWIESGLSLVVNAGGQTQTVTPDIGAANVLPITAIPVKQGGSTGSPLDIAQSMKQIWPLKDINVISHATYTVSYSLGATTNWDTLLQDLDNAHSSDGSARDWLGWVNITYQSGIFGIGYVGEGTALSADSDTMTSVHELGHNMDRNHAPCGGASSPDPNYPVSSAHLDGYGYDFVSGELRIPTVAYDIMGYCDPQWVSAFNYQAVQSWLESHPVSTSSAATGQPRIIIAGSVRQGGTHVELRPLAAILGPEKISTEGDWTATVRGNGKSVTVPFKLKQVADVGGEDLQHFSVLVPDLGAVDSVEISNGRKMMLKKVATVVHGTTEPKVAVVKAEGGVKMVWNEREWPYASIAHFDSAGVRNTLSLWREGGEAVVSTEGLPQGGSFEVSLSDGVSTKRVTVAR